MRKSILFVVAILGTMLGLGGCGKNLPAPTSPEAGPVTSWSYSYFGAIGIPSGGVSMVEPFALAVAGNDLWAANLSGSFQGWTLEGSLVLNTTSYAVPVTDIDAPHALAIGPDGYIYLGDSGNYQIAFFTPAGVYEGAFGHAYLPYVNGLAVSSTKVYVGTNIYPGEIVEIPYVGTGYLKTFGTPVTVTPSGQGTLTSVGQMTVDGSGNLYVADGGDQRVVKFSPSLSFLSAVTCVTGAPAAVAVDPAGNIFTNANFGVQVYSPTGALLTQFAQGTLLEESGIALDSADNVYLADYQSNDVLVYQKN